MKTGFSLIHANALWFLPRKIYIDNKIRIEYYLYENDSHYHQEERSIVMQLRSAAYKSSVKGIFFRPQLIMIIIISLLQHVTNTERRKEVFGKPVLRMVNKRRREGGRTAD